MRGSSSPSHDQLGRASNMTPKSSVFTDIIDAAGLLSLNTSLDNLFEDEGTM